MGEGRTGKGKLKERRTRGGSRSREGDVEVRMERGDEMEQDEMERNMKEGRAGKGKQKEPTTRERV